MPQTNKNGHGVSLPLQNGADNPPMNCEYHRSTSCCARATLSFPQDDREIANEAENPPSTISADHPDSSHALFDWRVTKMKSQILIVTELLEKMIPKCLEQDQRHEQVSTRINKLNQLFTDILRRIDEQDQHRQEFTIRMGEISKQIDALAAERVVENSSNDTDSSGNIKEPGKVEVDSMATFRDGQSLENNRMWNEFHRAEESLKAKICALNFRFEVFTRCMTTLRVDTDSLYAWRAGVESKRRPGSGETAWGDE